MHARREGNPNPTIRETVGMASREPWKYVRNSPLLHAVSAVGTGIAVYYAKDALQSFSSGKYVAAAAEVFVAATAAKKVKKAQIHVGRNQQKYDTLKKDFEENGWRTDHLEKYTKTWCRRAILHYAAKDTGHKEEGTHYLRGRSWYKLGEGYSFFKGLKGVINEL
jgi:hypothetical protein